jgi:hypothetical protein
MKMSDMNRQSSSGEASWNLEDDPSTTEPESDFGTDENPTSGDGSDSDPALFSDDEIDYSFVQAKQKILKRAADIFFHEERFDALTDLSEHRRYDPSAESIWDEAKDFMRTLDQVTGPITKTTKVKKPAAGRASKKPKLAEIRKCENPCDPRVDVTLVGRNSSTKFGRDIALVKCNISSSLNVLPTSFMTQCQWMTQVLLYNKASRPLDSNNSTDTPCWKIMSNPLDCSCGMIPPSSMDMARRVDLNFALSIVDEARLVTQSMPPFSVVHVNRAFQKLADLPCDQCLLGKPIESVIHVPTDSVPTEESDHVFWSSIITMSNTQCRLEAFPVVQGRSLQSTSSDMYMSHILICVQPPVAPMAHVPSVIAFHNSTTDVTSDASDVSKDDSSTSSTVLTGIWGTVG